ncbi:MAG: ROK family protein, partial [Armatimonadota bacterium]
MNAGERDFVGVDVGGTNIMALVVTAAGDVVARHKTPTQREGASMAGQISAAIDAVLQEAGLGAADLAGIGVAMPGSVDSRTGYLGTVPN